MEFVVSGTADRHERGAAGPDRGARPRRGQYLQDNLTTWGGGNTINVTLATPNATSTNWSLPLTISGNRRLTFLRQDLRASTAAAMPSKATKKIETFGLADADADHQRHAVPSGDHPDHHVHRHRHRHRRRGHQLDHAHLP